MRYNNPCLKQFRPDYLGADRHALKKLRAPVTAKVATLHLWKTKFDLVGFCFLGLFVMASLATAGIVPDGYPVTRYSSLWERSPFTISSVHQDLVPAGFAAGLALVGVAKIGTEDFVILLNKDSQERINVGSKANELGFKLISVEPNADPLKVSVTIQKGSEVAQVKYDQTLLAAQAVPPGNPQPIAPGGQPSAPNPRFIRVPRTLPIPLPYSVQTTTPVPAAGTLPSH